LLKIGAKKWNLLSLEAGRLPAAPIDGLPVWVPVMIAVVSAERICHCGVIMVEGWLSGDRLQMILQTIERQRAWA
jgi:hypothetical protein